MKKLLALMLMLALLLTCACAEETSIATVNGEELLYSEYNAIESAYLYQYEAAGVDLTDTNVYTYLQDLALTYAIEQMLIEQDMQAQGCYDFDEEMEAWFAQAGKAAFETALEDVKTTLFGTDSTLTADELHVYALAYAEALGVTEATYVDFYRTQYASANYYAWLTRENPVTDEDVQAAYTQRVADSKTLYENDVAAFETALSSDAEVWYSPAGYRRVLQILLPAEGDTAEDKLANTADTVAEINSRLETGEAFETLIREYGTDAAFEDESFFSTGYQVHPESIIWEDVFVATAFSEEMAQPGCWSKPFASDLGVHILYYLSDAPSGPIAMTEEIYEALAYAIYTERYTAAQAQRLEELADSAEIIFH